MQILFRIISETVKFLTFRNVKFNIPSNPKAYFLTAILFAWIAGVGRYWDHPSADWYQYAGLRSIAYIFILSTVLYVIVWPLRRERWHWLSVFVFVGLTSPLAWLYAIPVEQFTAPQTAIQINLRFLMVVALWRIALYGMFLWRYAGLRNASFVAALLAPLALILFALVALNLEDAIFEIMAGIERERTPEQDLADARFGIVNVLFVFSLITVPVWLLAYLIGLLDKYKGRA
ncbi:hypothetical protein [Litorimonas sp. WD9-15]|uniref:hypothetical protein n=1 Tax=Litorimonas sp. WD9-15 TaxID=3418716 RepID=UPI003CFF78A3